MTLALLAYDPSRAGGSLTNAGQLAPYRISGATARVPQPPLLPARSLPGARVPDEGVRSLRAGRSARLPHRRARRGRRRRRASRSASSGSRRLLARRRRGPAAELRDALLREVRAHAAGVEPGDDRTLVLVTSTRIMELPEASCRRALPAAGLLFRLAARLCLAQSSPFLDEKTERLLVDELSGDLAFETIRVTTQWHKLSGARDFFAVARHVRKAKAAGLEDVRWIDQKAETALLDMPERGGLACRRRGAEGRNESGSGPTRRSRPRSPTSRARPTSPRRSWMSAPGDRAADYARQGRPRKDRPRLWQSLRGDGAGRLEAGGRGNPVLVLHAPERALRTHRRPDRLAGSPGKDGPKGEKTSFAFILSARDGKALSDRLRGEARPPHLPGRRGGRGRPSARHGSSSNPSSCRRENGHGRGADPRNGRDAPGDRLDGATSRSRSLLPTTTSPASRASSRSAGR